MRMNAIFSRKENTFELSRCDIHKIIDLSEYEFATFRRNMLADCDFITECKDQTGVDKDGVHQCLLVLGEGSDDGILVNSSGYDYARYSAFIPGARQIVFAEQRYNCIQDLENALVSAADEVMSCALAYDGEGDFRVLIDDLADEHGFDKTHISLLAEMLNEHSPVNEVAVFSDEMIISLKPEFKKNPEKPRHCPGEDELKVMCAKHVLWNHDQPGGEQADFTNMDLTDSYLANADLNGAIFKGAILNAATLGNGSYTFCDFTDAEMYNVDAVDAVFEESDFTGAKLINGHFLSSHFTHCNFTGADLSGSDFNLATLDNSDFTNAKTDTAKLENARINYCTGLQSEPEASEPEETGGLKLQ